MNEMHLEGYGRGFPWSGSLSEKGHSPWNGSPEKWKELFNGKRGIPQGVAPFRSERHFLAGRRGIPWGSGCPKEWKELLSGKKGRSLRRGFHKE